MPVSSSAGGGTRRGRSKVGRHSPWAPMVEAAQLARRMTDDIVGMEGVDAMDAAPDAIIAVGEAFKAVGQQIAEQVDWDPRVLPFFEGLGDLIIRTADSARRGAAAVRRHEADRIENVEDGSNRRRRWDIGAHDGRR